MGGSAGSGRDGLWTEEVCGLGGSSVGQAMDIHVARDDECGGGRKLSVFRDMRGRSDHLAKPRSSRDFYRKGKSQGLETTLGSEEGNNLPLTCWWWGARG